jgi:hypothetical protein
MASQKDVDVKGQTVDEKHEGKHRRLDGLQGVHANRKEPRPQFTCNITQPPVNTSGGAVEVPEGSDLPPPPPPPRPQFTCNITSPPGSVPGGRTNQK